MRKQSLLNILWITPVILGTIDLILWIIIRHDWLMITGLIVIYLGLAFLLIALVFLTFFKIRKTQGINYKLSLVKLFSNFLICALYIIIVISININYTMQINNNSKFNISNVLIHEGNRIIRIKLIDSNCSKVITTFVNQDGKIDIEYEINNTKTRKSLIGYSLNSINMNNEYDIN